LNVGATIGDDIQPLIYEPGTSFRYSIGIDWAGWLVERITGQTLEDYFQENIFKPCGMDTTSFVPSEDIMSRNMVPCTFDNATGKVKAIRDLPTVYNKPIRSEDVGLFMG
jgi:methyl acetate hydrolase